MCRFLHFQKKWVVWGVKSCISKLNFGWTFIVVIKIFRIDFVVWEKTRNVVWNFINSIGIMIKIWLFVTEVVKTELIYAEKFLKHCVKKCCKTKKYKIFRQLSISILSWNDAKLTLKCQCSGKFLRTEHNFSHWLLDLPDIIQF